MEPAALFISAKAGRMASCVVSMRTRGLPRLMGLMGRTRLCFAAQRQAVADCHQYSQDDGGRSSCYCDLRRGEHPERGIDESTESHRPAADACGLACQCV